MKSYRTRLTVWFGTAFVVLLALVLISMFAIVYLTLYQEERHELFDLATRIELCQQALSLVNWRPLRESQTRTVLSWEPEINKPSSAYCRSATIPL